MISGVENSGAGGNSEFTNSAKTELINTTLKNVVWRRNRAANSISPEKEFNSSKSTPAVSGEGEYEDLGDFIAFWLTAFQNLFLIPRNKRDTCDIFESGDDICYIVERCADANGLEAPLVSVKRFNDIKNIDSLCVYSTPAIEWEETTYLNFLSHLCQFKLCCGILEKEVFDRRKPSAHRLVVKHQFSITTYAAPFRHRMDKKSSKNVPTYPNIYFLVDDFESVWDKVYLQSNQEFCVELVAEIDPKFLNLFPNKKQKGSKQRANQTTAFLGASSYTVIEEVFRKRQMTNNGFLSMTNLFNKKVEEERKEFINMTGPNKVGKAQVAVRLLNPQAAAAVVDQRDSSSFSVGSDSCESSFGGVATSCVDLPTLHCQITYVCVPCSHIIKMIFDSPKEPSLAVIDSSNNTD